MTRASASPTLPDTPELSPGDEDRDDQPTDQPEHPADNANRVPTSITMDEPSKEPDPHSQALNGDVVSTGPLPKSDSQSYVDLVNTGTTAAPATEDDGEDTETIKDGSVGRGAGYAQSGWLAKAFFGQQVEQDRGRKEKGEKVSARRRVATSRTVSSVGAPDPA